MESWPRRKEPSNLRASVKKAAKFASVGCVMHCTTHTHPHNDTHTETRALAVFVTASVHSGSKPIAQTTANERTNERAHERTHERTNERVSERVTARPNRFRKCERTNDRMNECSACAKKERNRGWVRACVFGVFPVQGNDRVGLTVGADVSMSTITQIRTECPPTVRFGSAAERRRWVGRTRKVCGLGSTAETRRGRQNMQL